MSLRTLRDDLSPFAGESVLTIGKYDGIHLGHQRLIERVVERAQALGVTPALITFDPHPLQVLRPELAPPLLTPLDEKAALLEALGIELLVLLTFDRAMAQTRAADFLDRLAATLRPRELWLGEDFALGYKREGDMPFIRAWAAPRGIAVESLPLVTVGGEPVSGQRIRALLDAGDVVGAGALLGRPPSVRGEVMHGEARGRTVGFPTANLVPGPERALPANGVYATRARLPDGTLQAGVTNIGVRPTFDGTERRVECHLFDWEGDLYGREITVHFLYRLREERRFESFPALLAQIRADAERARGLLLRHSA